MSEANDQHVGGPVYTGAWNGDATPAPTDEGILEHSADSTPIEEPEAAADASPADEVESDGEAPDTAPADPVSASDATGATADSPSGDASASGTQDVAGQQAAVEQSFPSEGAATTSDQAGAETAAVDVVEDAPSEATESDASSATESTSQPVEREEPVPPASEGNSAAASSADDEPPAKSNSTQGPDEQSDESEKEAQQPSETATVTNDVESDAVAGDAANDRIAAIAALQAELARMQEELKKLQAGLPQEVGKDKEPVAGQSQELSDRDEIERPNVDPPSTEPKSPAEPQQREDDFNPIADPQPVAPERGEEPAKPELVELDRDPALIDVDRGPDDNVSTPEPDANVTVPDPSDVVVPKPDDDVAVPKPDDDIVVPKPDDDIVVPKPDEDVVVVPKPDDDVVVPNPNDDVLVPTPDEAIVAPKPDDDMVVPTPDDAVVVPDPADAVTVPDPSDDVLVPKPDEAVVIPKPDEDVVVPKPDDDIVVPKPDDDVAVPKPDDIGGPSDGPNTSYEDYLNSLNSDVEGRLDDLDQMPLIPGEAHTRATMFAMAALYDAELGGTAYTDSLRRMWGDTPGVPENPVEAMVRETLNKSYDADGLNPFRDHLRENDPGYQKRKRIHDVVLKPLERAGLLRAVQPEFLESALGYTPGPDRNADGHVEARGSFLNDMDRMRDHGLGNDPDLTADPYALMAMIRLADAAGQHQRRTMDVMHSLQQMGIETGKPIDPDRFWQMMMQGATIEDPHDPEAGPEYVVGLANVIAFNDRIREPLIGQAKEVFANSRMPEDERERRALIGLLGMTNVAVAEKEKHYVTKRGPNGEVSSERSPELEAELDRRRPAICEAMNRGDAYRLGAEVASLPDHAAGHAPRYHFIRDGLSGDAKVQQVQRDPAAPSQPARHVIVMGDDFSRGWNPPSRTGMSMGMEPPLRPGARVMGALPLSQRTLTALDNPFSDAFGGREVPNRDHGRLPSRGRDSDRGRPGRGREDRNRASRGRESGGRGLPSLPGT